MNPYELEDLAHAKCLLENPGFGIKAANYLGRPIEYALEKLDSQLVDRATRKALEKSLDLAIGTIDTTAKKTKASNFWHKLAVGASGAGGGFFGMAALAIELPVSTTIMLRSIAEIARSQGHDLNDLATRFACLEVFAIGSDKTHDDDAAESAYYTARAGLAVEMQAALRAVEGMGQKAIQEAMARGQMPMLVRLIAAIASRFGVTVSEKLIAQAVPVAGALGGAGINLLFIDHFQQMAEGHFIVRRLEREYGAPLVEEAYREIVPKNCDERNRA
jgi:hypothetical protein